MTYLAAWLLALGSADLARPSGALPRGRRAWVPPAIAALVLVAGWWLTGARTDRSALGWLLLLPGELGWVLASARAVAAGAVPSLAGVRPGRPAGRGLRLLALGCLLGGTLLAVGLNGQAPALRPGIVGWYDHLGLRSLRGVDLAHALVVVGALLAQVGTANAVVRIGLDAAGARFEPGTLRGGRIVGPLERVFILGLGLAGQVTAASVVIAAKGLLRFPELTARGEQGGRIDVVTEYFVVGSLLSWLVALGSLCLARA